MFAPKIAKAGAKASASSTTALAPRHSSFATRPFDGAELEHGPSWDFAKIPLFPSERVQPKLTVGAVDDPLEREADRVADQAMGQSGVAVPLASLPASGQTDQSSADVSGIVERGLSGGGQPLPAPVRTELEPKFGLDFGKIRIHADSSASRSAHELSAKAYTVGPDIVFRAGAYAPGNADGKRLLAHELAHVAQQGAAAKFARTASVQPARSTVSAALPVRPAVNWRVVQRQASGAAIPPAGGSTPDYSKMSWLRLLPLAHLAKGRQAEAKGEKGAAKTEAQAKKAKAKVAKNAEKAAEKDAKAKEAAAKGAKKDVEKKETAAKAAELKATAAKQAAVEATRAEVEAGAKGAGVVAESQGQITWIDLHTPDNDYSKRSTTGEAPTLNYVPDKDIHIDPSPEAPQGGVGGTPIADALAGAESSDFASAQALAVLQIMAARSKIPDRPMGRSANNNAGYDYNPDSDAAAKEYNQWVKSARPTGVNDGDWNWQVFKQIGQLEGQEGRFTTFDKTLSVGPGYSTAGGQTQQVIGKMFKLLPEVESVAFDAGLMVGADGAMIVVDTDKKWILEGQDAAAYVQTNASLLSLLVNVSQGVQPVGASGGAVAPDEQGKQRQALLDAEWKQFVGGTLAGLTSLVKSWPLDSAVLAVHAKHAQPSNFPFTFWNAETGPDLATMVAAIYGKVGDSAKYICTGKYADYHKKSTGSGG
jgi:hypothetical protein